MIEMVQNMVNNLARVEKNFNLREVNVISSKNKKLIKKFKKSD